MTDDSTDDTPDVPAGEGTVPAPPSGAEIALSGVAAEVEAHVAQSGWDQRPALFALVRAADFARDEPDTAARLGLEADSDALTPIEQEELPAEALDEALAQIAWPPAVAGCAVAQEIVILPPSAGDIDDAVTAAAHPDRREARIVVAVLRDGTTTALLRLRDTPEDLLTGPDLAPNLAAALLATLED